jgi:hypothetical protein
MYPSQWAFSGLSRSKEHASVCRGLLHMQTATHLLHTLDRVAHMHASLQSNRAPAGNTSTDDGQMSHLDCAARALVMNQPRARAMLIRVLRYLRLGFEIVRDKILTELCDLSSLSVNERSVRVQGCRAAALQLAMAHEVCETAKWLHLPSSNVIWRTSSELASYHWVVMTFV